MEIILSSFSDHNTMRLEINYKKKLVKNTNTWRLNSMLLKNQQITEEIRENTQRQMKTKATMTQSLWDAGKAVLRGSLQPYNFTSGNKPNLTPRATRERTNKTQLVEIIKTRAEINERDQKKKKKSIGKKSWLPENIKLINLQPGSPRKKGIILRFCLGHLPAFNTRRLSPSRVAILLCYRGRD